MQCATAIFALDKRAMISDDQMRVLSPSMSCMQEPPREAEAAAFHHLTVVHMALTICQAPLGCLHHHTEQTRPSVDMGHAKFIWFRLCLDLTPQVSRRAGRGWLLGSNQREKEREKETTEREEEKAIEREREKGMTCFADSHERSSLCHVNVRYCTGRRFPTPM